MTSIQVGSYGKVNVDKDTKSVTFDLTCKDVVISRGIFNLVGTKGTSEDEAVHDIHAEYGRGTLSFDLVSKENDEIACVLTEEELESGSNEGNQLPLIKSNETNTW